MEYNNQDLMDRTSVYYCDTCNKSYSEEEDADLCCLPEIKKCTGTEAILKERGSRYGEFRSHAELQVNLETAIRETLYRNINILEPYMRVSLDMICHKIARICNGDPTYIDSWQDIAGYAELVVKELEKDK